MSAVLKYRLDQRSDCVVMMPKGSKILSVQEQSNIMTLWALVPDPNAWVERRRLELDWTGETLPPLDQGVAREHLATIMDAAGLVWHVFELVDKNKEVV